VIVDGFFEWKRTGKAKQPFLIHRSDRKPLRVKLGGYDAGPDSCRSRGRMVAAPWTTSERTRVRSGTVAVP
jgi:hypothetical protein